jgi:hypothetical protein
MKHVLEPITEPFAPEIAEVFKRFPQGRDGYILGLFRVFANSTRFLTKKGPANLLDKESPISLRDREIVILRVTANNECEYEWGVHVAIFSEAAKLNEDQVRATKLGGSEEGCWTAKESLLIECVDDICKYSTIRDKTYEKFQFEWDLDQQLEILALCGNYHLISFVANTSRISLEENGVRFPIPLRIGKTLL